MTAPSDGIPARVPGAPEIVVANEFSEVRVRRVDTRNGSRLLVESPRTGQWVSLCPLELEALTWQGPATFSAMIGTPHAPLVPEPEPDPTAGPGDDAHDASPADGGAAQP